MMRKLCVTILVFVLTISAFAQNSISVTAGYLGTRTSVAEYERVERFDFLLDSMTLSKTVASFQAGISARITLGKNLFLMTGFQYNNKGLDQVTFTDSTHYDWTTPARQHYLGISFLIGYDHRFDNGKWGIQLATGPLVDFAVGLPNGGALFAGPYSRFFMPFCRFNEVDVSWRVEGGCSREWGPGRILLLVNYNYGLSDVLEDPFVIGRTMSWGCSVGYALQLGK